MGHYCEECKEAISEKTYEYSINHFGKALCTQHQSYYCKACRQKITYGVYNYSINHFDEPLCRDCQPEKEEKISAPPQKYELNKTSRIEFGSYPKKKENCNSD